MILASKNYIDFITDNWEEWKQALKTDYDYCKELKDWQTFPCRASNLPSWHPYWTNEVKKSDYKDLNILKEKYKECKNNPDKIKYYFNNSTNIVDIEKMIKEKEKSIEGIIL